MSECPFCVALADPLSTQVALRTEGCAVLRDSFPVFAGHLLVVPQRHVPRVGDLRPAEWSEMTRIAQGLVRHKSADGYTMGVNDGPIAGQTVPHVHLHVIPRRVNDVPDPRGGIRMAFPNGKYW